MEISGRSPPIQYYRPARKHILSTYFVDMHSTAKNNESVSNENPSIPLTRLELMRRRESMGSRPSNPTIRLNMFSKEANSRILQAERASMTTTAKNTTTRKKYHGFLKKKYKSKLMESVLADRVTRLTRQSPPKPTIRRNSCAPKPPQVIAVKDILRDRIWGNKAKPKITNSFYLMINKSNGMKINPPEEPFFSYKYYLAEGNNSNIVRQIFASRPFWTRVPKEEKDSAHLVWAQSNDESYLKALPSLVSRQHVCTNSSFMISSQYNYIAPDQTSKVVDLSSLGYASIYTSNSFAILSPTYEIPGSSIRCHNKLEGNWHISNKKDLFLNLKAYYEFIDKDVFSVIPLTFHVVDESDRNFEEFLMAYDEKPDKTWIIKPGENTNRGNGISVCHSLEAVREVLRSNPHPKSGTHTFIIQKYIDKPLLVYRRKFDIRCFALVTCMNGVTQAYFYKEGYLRTACKAYARDSSDIFIHLTNDAVQKHAQEYGKFETGNKLSYNEFTKYIEKKLNFQATVLPQIKEIITNSIKAASGKLDAFKRAHTFEIFGYDFLMDEAYNVWLIEVNTNPCLETSCPLLARVITALLENSFRIAVDPIFREPVHSRKQIPHLFENNYELIYHSQVDVCFNN